MKRSSTFLLMLPFTLTVIWAACGGDKAANMDDRIPGYWIECESDGVIPFDGDGYAWGVVFHENGDMIRVRLTGNSWTITEDANGPFDKVVSAVDGQFTTREGMSGTFAISAVTTSQGSTYPFMSMDDGSQTQYYIKVMNLDGSSPEVDPLWDCSQEDHEATIEDAQENHGDNQGPIPDGCYPTGLVDTLTFESHFSEPRVPTISASFEGGELVAINGVDCDPVFPGQASTLEDCELMFVCGCCRLTFGYYDYDFRYSIEFARSGSDPACDDFWFSDRYDYAY
ncbi:MAG: hypothetical protein JXR96_04500 [Deltaproteobacteria bacterium]|nr:hypothetical protein [Deltaproteobacteria bacterium]